MTDLLIPTDDGLYCEEGQFFIDPSVPVKNAVISHGHADHGAQTSDTVHCTTRTQAILNERYDIDAISHGFGESFSINGVTISLYPANHVFGSAMIRVTDGTTVWLYTGDYKRDTDPTTTAYQDVSCDVLVTETTFALPIYQWRDPPVTMQAIVSWLDDASPSTTCFIFAYSLGKAQRVLAGLKDYEVGDIGVHTAIASMNDVYESFGVDLGNPYTVDLRGDDWKGDVIIAPQGVHESTTVQRLHDKETAMISGWMRVRGNRRWKQYDRGFALSDHCDWSALNTSVERSDAQTVYTVHGYTEEYAAYLESKGFDAEAWE